MKSNQFRRMILTVLALVLIFGFTQCRKQTAAPRPSPPPALVSPSERELADRSFLKGDYKNAAEAYGSYLGRNPDAEDKDITLLRLAISYAFLDDPSRDLARTEALLDELLKEPASAHTAEAELILRLVAEIRKLQEESSLKSRELAQVQMALQKLEERENRRWELEVADRNFARGNYESAVRGYSRYLEKYPGGEDRDRAVFHLAISHALPDSPVYDPERTEELLRSLVRNPDSPQKPGAEQVLRLSAQIRELRSESSEKTEEIVRLSTELERLKEIDLNIQPTHQPN